MRIKFNKRQRRLIKSALSPFQKRAKVDLYKVFTALAYLIRTGCQWRLNYPSIALIKADLGYRGSETVGAGVIFESVKSNFGTSEFKPLSGRWVVEHTNSWPENFRRLCRNYERYLFTARAMTYLACILFMLRYI